MRAGVHHLSITMLTFFAINRVAHFAVGVLKSLISIPSWWRSRLERTWIGIIVAVMTYRLGLAFRVLG